MENNYRKIYGRRGPNSRTTTGINYMRGYFIVQFFADDKPELYVINDENNNIFNNEIKSTSPLAKAVMKNKVGSSFFIEDYLEKDLGTTTGVSIIKKELEYINYNPAFDDMAQYNYYYIKSYLDYVKPREDVEHKELVSNGKKIYVDFEFVPFDKLNKTLNYLINELTSRLKYTYKGLSEKHKSDALLKIEKLKDLKSKNFYEEDLDYIKIDIEKYIFYELSYYEFYDKYILSLIEEIENEKESFDNSLYKTVIKSLKQILNSNTINEACELYNNIYDKLKTIGKHYLPKYSIEYSEFDYKPFDGYKLGCKKEISEILEYYNDKYNKLDKKAISKKHLSFIKKEINNKTAKNYLSYLEYEKHLDFLFDCDASYYSTFDFISKKIYRVMIENSINNEVIFSIMNYSKKIDISDNLEECVDLVNNVYYLLMQYNKRVGKEKGTISFSINLTGGSWSIDSLDNIYQLIIINSKRGLFEEHKELVCKAYDFWKSSKNKILNNIVNLEDIIESDLINEEFKDNIEDNLHDVELEEELIEKEQEDNTIVYSSQESYKEHLNEIIRNNPYKYNFKSKPVLTKTVKKRNNIITIFINKHPLISLLVLIPLIYILLLLLFYILSRIN